jgi:hypothetical protein
METTSAASCYTLHRDRDTACSYPDARPTAEAITAGQWHSVRTRHQRVTAVTNVYVSTLSHGYGCDLQYLLGLDRS